MGFKIEIFSSDPKIRLPERTFIDTNGDGIIDLYYAGGKKGEPATGSAAHKAWVKFIGSVDPRNFVKEHFGKAVHGAENLITSIVNNKEDALEGSTCGYIGAAGRLTLGVALVCGSTGGGDVPESKVCLNAGREIEDPSGISIIEYGKAKKSGERVYPSLKITVDIDENAPNVEPPDHKGIISEMVNVWEALMLSCYKDKKP